MDKIVQNNALIMFVISKRRAWTKPVTVSKRNLLLIQTITLWNWLQILRCSRNTVLREISKKNKMLRQKFRKKYPFVVKRKVNVHLTVWTPFKLIDSLWISNVYFRNVNVSSLLLLEIILGFRKEGDYSVWNHSMRIIKMIK